MLSDFEHKLCIITFKFPESDAGAIAYALSFKSMAELIAHRDGTFRCAISCELLQYDLNGIWISFRSEIEKLGPQDQKLFVPIKYVLSIKVYSEQLSKDAKIKPKIGF